jgi:ribonuclease HI
MNISVFARAAGSKTRGPSGYGVIILAPDGQFELSEHDIHATKRSMELRSLIAGLNILTPATLSLSSSSEYIARAISQGWIEKWRRMGFKTADGEGVQYPKLWLELARALDRHEKVQWMRVRNREGSQYDDLAEALARSAMAGRVVPLRQLGSSDVRPLGSANFRSVRF